MSEQINKVLVLANNEVGFYCFRKELAERLVSMGKEVFLSAPQGIYTANLEKMGVHRLFINIDRHGINPFTDFFLLLKYIKTIRLLRPNAVLTYTIKPNLYGSLASWICRIPCFSNITGIGEVFQKDSILKRILVFALRFSMRKNECLFFQNQENMNIYMKNGICGKKHILLPGSGVNLSNHSDCRECT